jgi:hypothetical protein
LVHACNATVIDFSPAMLFPRSNPDSAGLSVAEAVLNFPCGHLCPDSRRRRRPPRLWRNDQGAGGDRTRRDRPAASAPRSKRSTEYDAILGPLEPSTQPPREVGVLLKVRADDQDTATAIAKIANPLLLHLPLGDMTHLPSFAFTSSPAELERGPVFEFQLNHTINVSAPDELFHTEIREVTPR